MFYEYIKLQGFDDVIAFLKKHGKSELAESFSAFVVEARTAGLGEYIHFDPAIVRGLDYYTGIVFEMFDKHPDNRRALCGGGAYHNLLQIFNEDPLPGVGFGLGDVTLVDFLTIHNLIPNFEIPANDVMVTFQDQAGFSTIMSLARNLRKNNLKVVTMLEEVKMKKVFQLAEKKGCKFLVLLGTDEMNKGEILLKNLATRDQIAVRADDTAAILNFLK